MANTIKLTRVFNHYDCDIAAATLHAYTSTFPSPLFASICGLIPMHSSCAWKPTYGVIRKSAWLID